MKPSAEIEYARAKICSNISNQVESRSYRVANELRNASQLILRGRRGGLRHIVSGTGKMTYNKRKKTAKVSYTRYTASAPGEPPAVRTGTYRRSWMRKVEVLAKGTGYASFQAKIYNNTTVQNGHLLGDYLENGTPGGKMAPRPHFQKIQDKAKPNIMKIYQEPYF